MTPRRKRPLPPAFTLIELLVVIAIIAMLIGILIPALSAARQQARGAVCISNIRQLNVGLLHYATDYKEVVWPAYPKLVYSPDGGAWARLKNPVPDPKVAYVPGYIWDYVSNVDRIAECPHNKRRKSVGTVGNNIFNSGTALDFDYTFLSSMQGIKLSTTAITGFLDNPQIHAVNVMPPSKPAATAVMRNFRGTPVFFEEHTVWYNEKVADGLFGNQDQLEQRHGGRGSLAFLEGHAESFTPSQGPDTLKQEAADLDGNDIYVMGTQDWIRLTPGPNNYVRPFGWMNRPK